jgi:hypothetical protein
LCKQLILGGLSFSGATDLFFENERRLVFQMSATEQTLWPNEYLLLAITARPVAFIGDGDR